MTVVRKSVVVIYAFIHIYIRYILHTNNSNKKYVFVVIISTSNKQIKRVLLGKRNNIYIAICNPRLIAILYSDVVYNTSYLNRKVQTYPMIVRSYFSSNKLINWFDTIQIIEFVGQNVDIQASRFMYNLEHETSS